MRTEFKSLLIQRNGAGTFSPAGIPKKFHSLRELLGLYRCSSLQAEGVAIQLGTHCPPQPKGTLGTDQGAEDGSPTTHPGKRSWLAGKRKSSNPETHPRRDSTPVPRDRKKRRGGQSQWGRGKSLSSSRQKLGQGSRAPSL